MLLGPATQWLIKSSRQLPSYLAISTFDLAPRDWPQSTPSQHSAAAWRNLLSRVNCGHFRRSFVTMRHSRLLGRETLYWWDSDSLTLPFCALDVKPFS